MIQEFTSKLNNHEYISNYLYEYILNNNSSLIPTGFNIDNYNSEILDNMYHENKEYFDNMFKGIDDNIQLDEEQCKAILADEKYSLIIAGAGTGKTTTMTAKVKYLVDKKNADPERILVMSYTRKATKEIADRIIDEFDINVHVTTFHSLGYEYIREIFNNRKCVIIDRNLLNEFFLDYFKELYKDKNKITEIVNNFEIVKERSNFIFSNFFLNNFMKYDTFDELMDKYVIQKMNEAGYFGIEVLVREWISKQLLKSENIASLKGDYVKSAGEALIANFLYIHGLDYSYEEVYDELMNNYSIYKPDFTIDYGGEKIYIEYFGLDDEEYNNIKNKKIAFHKKKGNKFISLDRVPLSSIVEVLDKELTSLGVNYSDRSFESIYEHILRMNPLSQVYPIMDYLYDCVKARKESIYRDDPNKVNDYLNSIENIEERKQLEIQKKYIDDFYNYYANRLFGGEVYYFDYCDLLYYSVKYLEKLTIDTKLRFDYIIIDEYQDISSIKYELTYKTAKRNDAKVYAVGDDWQSIYAFSGSRIEYIYKFKEFFEGAKSFRITKTYRNSQELINYSGEFIMKNDDQIKKNLISNKHIDKPVIFIPYGGRIGEDNEVKCLKTTIIDIHQKYPDHNILVLARTNAMIDTLLEDEELVDGIGTKIIFKGNPRIDIEGMTMHKSKGLTFDEVIIVGLNKSFPITKNNNSWYEYIFKNKPIEEAVPFAEERRLFYVALTRTKNRVYLLCNENSKYRSDFIKELGKIITNK
jgi:DNA helicase-4